MSDPEIRRLRKVDPDDPSSEPDWIGRLEPLDPDADDSPGTEAGAGAPGTDDASSTTAVLARMRDGALLAVVLAMLLSVSAVAALVGLIAVQTSPLERASADLPSARAEVVLAVPIRLGVGPESTRPEEESPVDRVAVPAPVAVQTGSDGAAGGSGNGGGDGSDGGGGDGGEDGDSGGGGETGDEPAEDEDEPVVPGGDPQPPAPAPEPSWTGGRPEVPGSNGRAVGHILARGLGHEKDRGQGHVKHGG